MHRLFSQDRPHQPPIGAVNLCERHNYNQRLRRHKTCSVLRSREQRAPKRQTAVQADAKVASLGLNLFTGTVLSLAAQQITNMNLADINVHALAITKYAATAAFTSVQRPEYSQAELRASEHALQQRRDHLSRRAQSLMAWIGVLDTVSYVLHCLGLAICGVAAASVVSAAAGQTFTALLTRVVLKRTLRPGQKIAVAIVLVGILVRAASFGSAPAATLSGAQLLGYGALFASCLGYSVIGVVYDVLVTTENPAPTHGDIMGLASKIGLAAMVAYQVFYVVPRWSSLVSAHLHASHTSPFVAIAALAAFGVIYVCHTYAQAVVQRSQGALAVGLVGAIRSTTTTLASAVLFCGAAAVPLWQRLSPQEALSAAVVTIGGIVWVMSGQQSGLQAVEEEKVKQM